MKIQIRIARLALAVALAITPHLASGAVRNLSAVSASPTSRTVTAGVATNVTSTITVATGSSGTGYKGNVQLTTVVSGPDGTVTAGISPTTVNLPANNASATPTLTVTTTSASLGTYTITVNAFGDGTGTGGTAGNTTAGSTGPTNTTFTVIVSAGVAFVPGITWTAGGVNTNWSTGANWSATVAPVSSNDVIFVDTGATNAAGTVNNVVDTSLTIGSLNFGQTNKFHTTLIAPGVTLTVGGDTNGLVSGTGTDNGATQATTNTITGAGGTLNVTNTSANILVNQANAASTAARATLDLSGLGTFQANAARLLVGIDAPTKGASGALLLARTNTIRATAGSTAPQVDVGDNTQSGGANGLPSSLVLGQTNAFFVDSLTVSRGKGMPDGSSMFFNSAFTGPTAVFRGTNGSSSRVGTWSIGDGSGSKIPSSCVGINDFSLGTVDALVDTMYVGKGASVAIANGANLPGTGTLIFNAGTINVNTLEVGYSVSATGTGTVNANGGALVVNTTLELGHSGGTGTLNISGATVTANNGIISGGTATIALSGSTLNATNATATIGSGASPIGIFNITNSALQLSAQKNTASVTVSALGAGGVANTLNVSSIPAVIGTYPAQFRLIQYSSASGDLNTFALGTLPGSFQGYLSNNISGNSLDLVVTNGPAPIPVLTWAGAVSGDWDTATANWKPHSGVSAGSPVSGPDTTYSQGSFVTFDDTLTGTSTVNLTTVLAPAGLTINSTTNYSLVGSGKISGSVGLVKAGSGSLILAETGGDNFSGGLSISNGTLILASDLSGVSGGVTISGGTLQVGNGGSSGALPASPVTDNSALVFNRSDNVTITNVISGAGSLTQNNTNVLTLSGANNSYSGAITVAQGTLQAGNSNVIGAASSLAVSSGATLDVNGQALFGAGAAPTVTISGAGASSAGAIVNGGASQTRVLHTVTLAADATVGGTGDWDIRNSSGGSATADAQLNGGFNLTKVGTNTLTLRGVTVDANLGNINVQAGALTITATPTAAIASLGNANSNATAFANATLTLDSIGIVPGKIFVLTNGGTLRCTGTNAVASPVILTGLANNTINVGSNAQLSVSGIVSGAGSLSKNGASALFLSATNTYSGKTVVSSGTLALTGQGSIANSSVVTVSAGSTLDASGRTDGTLTLASGQTLTGTGTVLGTLIAGSGATLEPASATSVGTLTNTGSTLLQSGGTNIVKVVNAVNGFDTLAASANVGVTASSGNPFTVRLTSLDGTGAGDAVTNFDNNSSYSWAIVSGTPTNIDVSGLAIDTGSFANDLAGGIFNANTNAGGLVITFTNNHAPTANTMTLTRTPGVPVKILITDLLTNTSDPDGDATALVGIPSGSTNGLNNLASDSTYIFYTPGTNGNVTDAFSYTIQDVRSYRTGDTVRTATGTVVINIASSVTGQAQSISLEGPTAQVTFAGIPTYPYVVERSTNLTAWVSLLSTNAPANGIFHFTDDFSDIGGQPLAAYYRLRYAP